MSESIINNHYLLILDRSGSMESVRRVTISGFNEQVQTTKELAAQYPDQRFTVSLVLFNDQVEPRLVMTTVDELREMTLEEYIPSGSTALHDAVGHSVTALERRVVGDDKVVVTIFTDGEENASTEYRFADIRAMISRLQAAGNWTFSYVGANQDAMQQAESYNIPRSNAMNYTASEAGTAKAFAELKFARQKHAGKVALKEETGGEFFGEEE